METSVKNPVGPKVSTRPSRQSMTIRERVLLSPYEKYKKFGLVPVKEILHILLVILTTWQVC